MRGVKRGITEADLKRAGIAAPSKYRNRKVEICGHKFDSQKEASRYIELGRLQKIGLISGLQLQVRFPIRIGGTLVCTYIADFVYREVVDNSERRVVEDVKSAFTRKNPVYRIKAKLMHAVHGVEIREA